MHAYTARMHSMHVQA